MRPPIVILAGGKGTRLGELTNHIPKPMVEVNGKPFLKILVDHYRKQGFTDFIISTGYLASIIHDYDFGIKIEFLEDDEDHNPYFIYRYFQGCWVVNGDTFIPEKLPDVDEATILSLGDIDAGAQFVDSGKIHIKPILQFFDIGTLEGLERFRDYAKREGL